MNKITVVCHKDHDKGYEDYVGKCLLCEVERLQKLQPLTDKQIEKVWGIHHEDDEHFDITFERDITRAIEAAHGIKE